MLRGRTDEELSSISRAGPLLPTIFERMAAEFRPDQAEGFSGDIEYALSDDGEERSWTVRVEKESAVSLEEPSPAPALRIRMTVPTFLRTIAGEVNPALAAMEGTIALEGDMMLAVRLGPMFGRDRF
jgi:putative sterol carrier protein